MSTPVNQIDKIQFSDIDLIPRLISELGYKQYEAELVARNLVGCDPLIKSAFWRWWQTGTLDPDLEIEGYRLTWLVKELRFKPPAAFLDLDWLLKDPKLAKPTLARGFDRLSD